MSSLGVTMLGLRCSQMPYLVHSLMNGSQEVLMDILFVYGQ